MLPDITQGPRSVITSRRTPSDCRHWLQMGRWRGGVERQSYGLALVGVVVLMVVVVAGTMVVVVSKLPVPRWQFRHSRGARRSRPNGSIPKPCPPELNSCFLQLYPKVPCCPLLSWFRTLFIKARCRDSGNERNDDRGPLLYPKTGICQIFRRSDPGPLDTSSCRNFGVFLFYSRRPSRRRLTPSLPTGSVFPSFESIWRSDIIEGGLAGPHPRDNTHFILRRATEALVVFGRLSWLGNVPEFACLPRERNPTLPASSPQNDSAIHQGGPSISSGPSSAV